ncbi:MAG: hypothetical protein AMJ64_02735 [Betaproteobacteria bacterium SG8_39]|nr:MAG: hypothetical protein AMJ64_02735 [Betaproteobacteria bacterium SG8_39]
MAVQLLAWTAVLAENQRPAAADPADPKAPVPETKYQSALEGYQPYEETRLRDWREANDEAGALGGHMGQVRGRAQAPQHAGPKAPRPMVGGER